MTNSIFYALFFALFLNVSVGSLKFSQIHRTFMSLYKGMFETCTITINKNGEPIVPYFNQLEMSLFLKGYFSENLSKYTKSYKYTYKFLTDSGAFCLDQCRRVQIRLQADINTFYKYDKVQTFAVVDGDSL